MEGHPVTRPKVSLYLDIDGVLNAFVRHALPNYQSLWEGGYHQTYPDKKSIHTAPAMVAALNDLIAEHSIACHWLTTWEEDAPAFGEDIGLTGSGAWPVLAACSGRGSDWPKFTSIRDHVEATRPDVAIWFDDDLATEPDARAWAAQNRVLAIAPGNLHGIEPAHLEAAREHIRAAAVDGIIQDLVSAMGTPATRDPARINGVLDAIRLVWTAQPDLRLAQLILGAGATFNTEDDELVERVLGLHRRK